MRFECQIDRRLTCLIVAVGVFVLWFACRTVSATAEIEKQETAESLSHYIMGLVHDWNGTTESAIEEYQKAAKFDSSSYAIHLRLGSDYARIGKLDQAISEFELAAKLNPKDLQPHYLLALVYSANQDYEKAAGEYEIILKRFSTEDPKNTEIFNYLGQLYYSQKKFDKAIEQYRQILILVPKNAEAIFMIGSLYLDLENRPQAMEYFKKALAIDPEHENSLNSLGYMYAEDGTNLDEALTLINKAIEIDPENGAYLDSLGWVYYKKGMYQEALGYLQKAGTLYKDPTIFDHLGDVCYKMKQNQDAEKYWKESLELLPQQDPVLKKLEALKKGEQPIQ